MQSMFFASLLAIRITSFDVSTRVFYQFLNRLFVYLLLDYLYSLYFGIVIPYQMSTCKYILPVLTISVFPLNHFIYCIEAFQFDKIPHVYFDR